MSYDQETPPEPSLGHLVSETSRLIRRYFDQRARAAQLGLTRSQAAVLAQISLNEGTNQASLAQVLEIEPITLVRFLDRLQAAGLVERRPDPQDRRARILFLTPTAWPLVARIRALSQSVMEDAMTGIDETQRRAFATTLIMMKANMAERICKDSDGTVEKEAVNG